MKWLIFIIAAGMLWFYWRRTKHASALVIGQLAPGFKLPDQHGKMHTLADFQGNWLAMYFYPKDDTPGCTKQASRFNDNLQKLKELDAAVIGVSVDNANSHADFAKKHNLQFPLLADDKGEIAARYDSLINLGITKFARRNTFLIDPQGNLAKIYLAVSAAHNSTEVIEDLKRLQGI